MAAVLQPVTPVVNEPIGPIAARLARFVAETGHAAIPQTVRERARYLILDAIGCGLAALRFDFAPASFAAIAELGGTGEHTVIGHSSRLPLRDAVLLNGILTHGLDYDDTHSAGVIHLTVSTLPCALGVAERVDASGRDLLTAYILGLETGARIASVPKGGFHQIGFHPTGLVGAFACALVAGRLQGATERQLATAQGIALSVGSGSLEFLEDGSWTKRMHPGWAAVAGITAAALARRDFVGPKAAYEGRFGLYASHLGGATTGCDFALATAGLGISWETMNIAVKPFPACHFVHAAADAAINLHERGVRAADVASIRALVPAETVKAVCEPVANKKRPASDYDAKFSIPFVVAASLIRGRFGLAELDQASLNDPAILALADKVQYEIDPRSGFPKYYSGEVIATLNDGREVGDRQHMNRGCADRPISNSEVESKFLENAAMAVSRERAMRIRDAVLGLDEARSVRDFARVLAG